MEPKEAVGTIGCERQVTPLSRFKCSCGTVCTVCSCGTVCCYYVIRWRKLWPKARSAFHFQPKNTCPNRK